VTGLRSTRTAFGEALLELAEEGLDLAAVSADTSKSMGVDILKEKFPERCFDCGIAEQNMMMISAGLAATGKTVFAASYSAFMSMRTLEQLRTFICYPGLDVKVAAGLGGLSAGIEGVTHMSLEDIGIVRCIPDLIVLNPPDYSSTKKIMHSVSRIDRPCYIRLGRDPSPVIFGNDYTFSLGKANTLINSGSDLGIITSGIILHEVLSAVQELQKEGIGVRLIELPTLKPADRESIIDLSRSTERIVTIDEHNIIGGLYTIVSEILCCTDFKRNIDPISVPDTFIESGSPDELRKKYGLDSKSIVKDVIRIVNKK
jgi:transketolase